MTETSTGPITAYCDGGSRGNPGPAGYGVFIESASGAPVGELSEFIGTKTNNVAEYSALVAALGFAIEHGHPHLKVVADSELMVKQMKGQYRVNSPDLKPLYEEAKRRAAKLKKFEITHVLRGKNKEADRLANEAMDRGTGRGPAGRPAASITRPPAPAPARPANAPAPAPVRRENPAQGMLQMAASSEQKPLADVLGFVKGGVVHLVEGELPEGTFVRIVPVKR